MFSIINNKMKMNTYFFKFINQMKLIKMTMAFIKIQLFYKNCLLKLKINKFNKILQKFLRNVMIYEKKILKDYLFKWIKRSKFLLLARKIILKKPFSRWFCIDKILSQFYRIFI